MVRLGLTIVICCLLLNGFAQTQIGQWSEYYSYHQIRAISVVGDKLVAATANNVLLVDENRTIHNYSKLDGLADVDIADVIYLPAEDATVVLYRSGVLDIIRSNKISTIRSIVDKLGVAPRINSVIAVGSTVYLATSVGIIKINIEKNEVAETYAIGENGMVTEVDDISYSEIENSLLAVVGDSIKVGKLDGRNLMNFRSWSGVFKKGIKNLEIVKGEMYALLSNNLASVAVFKEGTWVSTVLDIGVIHDLQSSNGSLTATGNEGSATLLPSNKWETSVSGDSLVCIGYLESGLLVKATTQTGVWMGEEQILPQGPSTNLIDDMYAHDNELWVVGGQYADVFKENVWQNNTLVGRENSLVLRTPDNTIWIGDSEQGILPWTDTSVGENIPAVPTAFTQTNEGDFWFVNRGSDYQLGNIPVGGELKKVHNSNLVSRSFKDLIVFPNNDKWLLSASKIYAFNEGDSLSTINDDKLMSFSVQDENSKVITNDLTCFTHDNDGAVWVGSPKGILVYGSPSWVLSQGEIPIAYRLVSDNDEGAAYLLSDKQVTDIIVDGANNKWISTDNSGLYYVSESGSEVLEVYSVANSPLPSNSIKKMSLDGTSGLLYVLTDKGLVALHTLATKGSTSYSDAYVYPNPVRPGYNGPIVFTGLLEGSTIKLTDVSGNLVTEMESSGGQAQWDGINLRGNKVTTGVYFAFVTSLDNEETAVIKLLFIH